MYISHKHEVVFIALPKNASRTVGVLLKSEFDAVDEDHHSIVPSDPEKIKNYFPFVVVRNPYSRCVSRWYGWYQVAAPDPSDLNFRKTLLPSFEGYVERMQDWHTSPKRIEPENALYHSCQIHIIDKAQKLFFQEIKKVKFEKLHEELMKLPFIRRHVKLPKRGIRNDVYGDWRRYYKNATVVHKVANAYQADFERLNYNVTT
jgi:hypothetical protein